MFLHLFFRRRPPRLWPVGPSRPSLSPRICPTFIPPLLRRIAYSHLAPPDVEPCKIDAVRVCVCECVIVCV